MGNRVVPTWEPVPSCPESIFLCFYKGEPVRPTWEPVPTYLHSKNHHFDSISISHFPNFRYIRTYTQLSLIFTQLHISNKLLTCINIIYHKYQQNHVNSYKIIKT